MKAFVVLLIIAGLAFGAWKMGYLEIGLADPGGEEGTEATDADAPAGLEGFPGNDDGQAQDPPDFREVHDIPDVGGGPPPWTADLSQAEARWQEIVEAGGDPTLHAETVALSRAFTKVFKAAYDRSGGAALQERLIEQYLRPIAEKLFFSRARYEDDASGLVGTYVVKSGDVPETIGRQFGMSYQFVNILRGRQDVEDGNLRLGDRFKVLHLKESDGFELRVDKSEYHLDVFLADCFVRRYPVGIGATETPTPTGTTFIDARERDPAWFHPKTNERIRHGDPDHVIGDYWIRLNDGELGVSGIGFHGYTGEGPAVEAQVSNGCLRMRNEDIAELFNLLPPVLYRDGEFSSRAPKTTVTIVE